MSELKLLGGTIKDTDYVLEIRVANKSTNFRAYMQKDMLEELLEGVKRLKDVDKCFDINIVEE